MRNTNVVGTLVAMAAFLLTLSTSTMAQPPTPVLRSQPDSPLEILSMQPSTTPVRTAPQAPQNVVAYDIVARNKTSVPVMAYAIRIELSVGNKIALGCQSSMGFSRAMINAGEIRTIQALLQKGGPTVTPVVDLVLLQTGAFYGADTCGVLRDYTAKLEERGILLRVVQRRLEKDGIEKTIAWIKDELSVDVSALRAPKRMK